MYVGSVCLCMCMFVHGTFSGSWPSLAVTSQSPIGTFGDATDYVCANVCLFVQVAGRAADILVAGGHGAGREFSYVCMFVRMAFVLACRDRILSHAPGQAIGVK